MSDKRYVAVNKRPECDEKDCYTCSYFDHDGKCTIDDKTIFCDYCRTAYSDERLNKGQDFSAFSLGKCSKGFGASIVSSASLNPPVEITVRQWNEQHKRNHDIFRFTPKYCPMCGRLITENEPYLYLNDAKTQNNV